MINILSCFKPAPHIPRLPQDQVDRAYRRHQILNFIAIFLGYASCYLLRKNFALAMPYLAQLGYTKSALGGVLCAIPLSYGISKFIMGNISDHSNPRYFLVTGLLLSALTNVIFGTVPAVINSIPIMFSLLFFNGWMQGMGAPPCYRTVTHWFSPKRRGRVMSFWSLSHNIGAAALGLLVTFMMTTLHWDWHTIFWVPALIVTAIALLIFIILCDTPQSVGLMPIEEYSGEVTTTSASTEKEQTERELSGKEILFHQVLNNKYIWFLAFASIFVSFVRYGVADWAPTYLSQVKGLALSKSSSSFFYYEMAGLIGMLLCGHISDRLTKESRALVSIGSLILVTISLFCYWKATNIFYATAALIAIGTFIYGPVILLGIQAMDFVSKKAVGTAIGFLGLTGYWGGNLTASYGFGILTDKFGWNAAFTTMLIGAILAIACFALTLNAADKK